MLRVNSIMPHILIAESLDIETLDTLARAEGWLLYHNIPAPDSDEQKTWHVSYQPNIMPDALKLELGRYDALVVRPKEVSGDAIGAASERLKLIVRGGAGVNSIDLEAAHECGVVIENTPGRNSISTAEYAFALIIELAANRHIVRSYRDVLSANVDIPEHYQGKELAGQKIAILGMGAIGLELAKRAAAFDMDVIYHTRHEKDVPYRYVSSLDKLLSEGADIISLHVPLKSETAGFIDDCAFNFMKKGTVLINTARPQLVQPKALEKALKNGIISRFAIDGDMDLIAPFVAIDNKKQGIITHHIADSTKQAQEKITKQVLRQLQLFFERGEIMNRVV